MYYDVILDEVLAGDPNGGAGSVPFPGGTVSVPVVGDLPKLTGDTPSPNLSDFQHNWGGTDEQYPYISIGCTHADEGTYHFVNIHIDLTDATSFEDIAARLQEAIQADPEEQAEFVGMTVQFVGGKFVLTAGVNVDLMQMYDEGVSDYKLGSYLGFTYNKTPVFTPGTTPSATFAVAAGTKYIVASPTPALTISSVETSDSKSVVLFTAGTAGEPRVSYPASLREIGSIPQWEAGKSYIMSFADNRLVAAEDKPGSAE